MGYIMVLWGNMVFHLLGKNCDQVPSMGVPNFSRSHFPKDGTQSAGPKKTIRPYEIYEGKRMEYIPHIFLGNLDPVTVYRDYIS